MLRVTRKNGGVGGIATGAEGWGGMPNRGPHVSGNGRKRAYLGVVSQIGFGIRVGLSGAEWSAREGHGAERRGGGGDGRGSSGK